MLTNSTLAIWTVVLLALAETLGVSYNLPKLSPCASWNAVGTTFANSSYAGISPYGIFINTNNTVYVVATSRNMIYMWYEGNVYPARNYSGNLNTPYSVFVTNDGDVYVETRSQTRVSMWTWNSTIGNPVVNNTGQCYSLFIDINNTLYCSNDNGYQVIKTSLNSDTNIKTVAAGNGTSGSGPYMLRWPNGIFVDFQFNLYVADSGNNRIQLFKTGQLNGTTVAGNGAAGTIPLSSPTGVVLDADGYVFIVDMSNHRIVGSGPTGFRCIVGCLSGNGPALDQLNLPRSMAFDAYGNIFVADTGNGRIEKFILATNSCAGSFNQPTISSCAVWSPNATTIANVSTIGQAPTDIFVNTGNTIYATAGQSNQILVSPEASNVLLRNISTGVNSSFSLFITDNGDIYVSSGDNGQVNKWTWNSTNSNMVRNFSSRCNSLFVDLNDTLYCSNDFEHKVTKTFLNDITQSITLAAGNGSPGSSSSMLYAPCGIFVDTQFNLYVADCGNNRIQRFTVGELNGTTITTGSIILSCPVDITFDNAGYLYIIDYNQNRIIGGGPAGFQCIVACSGSGGSTSSQLNLPTAFSFDTYGNIFVIDKNNGRIQKFSLLINYCSETTTVLASTMADVVTTTDLILSTTIETTSFMTTSQTTEIITTSQQTSTSILTTMYDSTTDAPSTIVSTQFLQTSSYQTDTITTSYEASTSSFITSTSMLDSVSLLSHSNTTIQVYNSTIDETSTTLSTDMLLTSSYQTDDTVTSEQLLLSSIIEDVTSVEISTTKPFFDVSTVSTSESSTIDGSITSQLLSTATTITENRSTIGTQSTIISTALFSTNVTTSSSYGTVQKPPPSFIPSMCANSTNIGSNCSISVAICDMLQPCQNSGTCLNMITAVFGYTCICQTGFKGTYCEIDYRICKPNTCYHNGMCREISNTTFLCLCPSGWEGTRCETQSNYCENVTCENNGVCRPSLLNYTCQCLGDSYSGRHCETISSKIATHQTIVRSFGYIAIIMLISVAIFVLVMDILKYGFGINVTHVDSADIRNKNKSKKAKSKIKPPVVIRFIYVNSLPDLIPHEASISAIETEV